MSINLSRRRKQFGQRLRQLRTERKLTCDELGKRANLDFSTVAAIERGQRQAGQSVSRRLADALGLQGDMRRDFVVAALATTRRDRVPEEASGFGAEVFRPVWAALEARNIKPKDVKRVHSALPLNKDSKPALRKAAQVLAEQLEQKAKAIRHALTGQDPSRCLDLVLEMADGNMLVLEVKLAAGG